MYNNYSRTSSAWDASVEFATRRAWKLLRMGNVCAPPILPERLASSQGIKRIITEDLGYRDGLLIPLDEGFEIKLNATHPPERQHFSCAHEIGHTFFLEKGGIALTERIRREHGDKVRNNWLENLCDLAAAELLMPSIVFGKYAAKYKFTLDAAVPLSKIFETSIEATSIRLCDFMSKPCYILRFTLDESQHVTDCQVRADWLTWSGMREPKKASRLIFKPSVMGDKSSIRKAFTSASQIHSREWIGIMNFRGYSQIWSQGFTNGTHRFVMSLVFPESYN